MSDPLYTCAKCSRRIYGTPTAVDAETNPICPDCAEEPMTYQLFDILPPAVEDALRESIREFGVIVPVVVDQHGQILDGHHRKRIADELGVDVAWSTIAVENEEHGKRIALDLNTNRRQVSRKERLRMVKHLSEAGHTTRAIAEAVGASKSQVDRDEAELSRAGQLDKPDKKVGKDGKVRPSKRPPVVTTTTEAEAEAVGEALDLLGDAAPEGPADPKKVKAKAKGKPPVSKPDFGGGVSHPAPFSAELLPLFAELLEGHDRVLDPFAGTGRIHDLPNTTVGVELEPEWAALHPDTIIGNALALPFANGEFDAICTSPTYGNRLADSHDAKDGSVRRSYTHDLGRDLTEDNSGAMQWGDDYREFHRAAWIEAVRVLRDSGLFVLNMKDHIRDGKWQDVSAFHAHILMELGLRFITVRPVVTGHLKQGENADQRVGAELVWVFEK